MVGDFFCKSLAIANTSITATAHIKNIETGIKKGRSLRPFYLSCLFYIRT